MCDTLPARARGKRGLVRSCGCFNCLFQPLNGASDKSANHVLHTMPRTPPPGLRRAIILPSRNAAMIGSGTFACANFRKPEEQPGIAKVVEQNAQMLDRHPRWTSCCPPPCRTEVFEKAMFIQLEWRGHGALLLQEWDRGAPELAWQGQTTDIAKVWLDPGATEAPSTACLAEDSSPKWTNISTLAALAWIRPDQTTSFTASEPSRETNPTSG